MLIVGSAVSPLLGKLGDNYGKKKILLVALGFYTFGVGIAGFSPNIYFLIFSRALQGFGFGMFPLALAIMVDVFPRERLAGAQGLISGTALIGGAAGLVIGSFVVQNLGWQFAFHTAFVLSIILFVIIARLVHSSPPRAVRSRIDYFGATLLTGGVVSFLLYLTEGPTLGWYSAVETGLVTVAVVLTALFFLVERRRESPLIQLNLLRIRNVLVANLVGIISGAALFIIFFAVVYYAELPPPFGLGLDIITTGLALAPATLTTIPVALVVGRVMPRVGPRPILVVGSIIAVIGFLFFGLNRTTTIDITVDIILAFGGAIAVIIPIVNMISMSLPEQERAVGLGMNQMLRNLGSGMGPVIATTIMSTYTVAVAPGVFLPSSTAFNTVFATGIALMVLIMIIGLRTKNYIFRKPQLAGSSAEPQASQSEERDSPIL